MKYKRKIYCSRCDITSDFEDNCLLCPHCGFIVAYVLTIVEIEQ